MQFFICILLLGTFSLKVTCANVEEQELTGFDESKQSEFIDLIRQGKIEAIKEYYSHNSQFLNLNYTNAPSLADNQEFADKTDLNPLYWAVKNGSIEPVEFLVKSGAEPTTRNLKGECVLHWAAQCGQDNIIIYYYLLGYPILSNSNQVIHIEDKSRAAHALMVTINGQTAAHEEGIASTIRSLLLEAEKLAYRELVDAIKKNDITTITVELNKQIALNYQNAEFNNQTLLHNACSLMKTKSLQELLREFGAHDTLKDSFGRTPNDYQKNKRTHKSWLLIFQRIQENRFVEWGLEGVTKDFDFNTVFSGRTLLHQAFYEYYANGRLTTHHDWTDFLRKNGTHEDIPNQQGLTPEQYGRIYGGARRIQTLLSQFSDEDWITSQTREEVRTAFIDGAYVDGACNSNNKTYSFLDRLIQLNDIELVGLLLSNQAHLNVCGKKTSWDHAVDNENKEMFQLLIEHAFATEEKMYFSSNRGVAICYYLVKRINNDPNNGALWEILRLLLDRGFKEVLLSLRNLSEPMRAFVQDYVPVPQMKSAAEKTDDLLQNSI